MVSTPRKGRGPILSEKVAIVTGGASGIGRETALLFAEEGAAVTIVDLDARGGEETAQEIKEEGFQSLFVQTDVTSEPDCKEAIQRTVSAFGQLDVLFNNAGIIHRTSVLNTAETDWDRVMGVNVKGVFLMSKHAIPAMRNGGVIINSGSGWGLVGGPNAASYCASKGAVVQLTRAMALDHAKQGIRVNCICPGDIDTPLLMNEADQLMVNRETFRTAAAERPLGRIGTAKDVAKSVLYLASEAAGFVTGTTLVVDGGGLAGSTS